MKRLLLPLVGALLLGLVTGSCGHGSGEVKHSDYGYCHKTGRHKHNDHVFIGDFHDESLCEWEKYQ